MLANLHPDMVLVRSRIAICPDSQAVGETRPRSSMIFSERNQDDIRSQPQSTSSENTAGPVPPPPPEPSHDQGIMPGAHSPSEDLGALPESHSIDIFTLAPVAALKLLCGLMETLVRITGDVPPTPPISHPNTPNLRVIEAEKESIARHARDGTRSRPRTPQKIEGSEDVDAVPAKAKTPIGSPESGPGEPLHIIGANMEPLNLQQGAIARKFYSKKPPPITLEEYLLRLHRYCPMSTAVYLATGLYIHRLAVTEQIIPVTARNVHRLLLSGLRVAMKALEDLSYPHKRFARVGGVTETELGRLEVSFCFVTNFELKVDKEMLLKHAMTIKQGSNLWELPVGFQPRLPPLRNKSKASVIESGSIPMRDLENKAPAAV